MPRPMYFFAIDTTSRRLADVSCSRASRPILTTSPLAVAHLGLRRDLGVEAHPAQQVRVVAGLDPALERVERDPVAGPVVDRPQPDVVARVEVAVVDREVRPVEDVLEGSPRRAPRCRPATIALGLLEQRRRALGLGVLAGLHEVEVRARRRAARRRSGAASASATIPWVSGPNGRLCWGLVVRVLRSVSWSVHSWSERTAFHGSMMICSPSSIALARTTSSSAVRSATLPISLRYIRTGSSIPIMSADSASSSSAVGSSTSAALSLAGASRPAGTTLVRRRRRPPPRSTISTLSSAVLGSASSSALRSMSSSSVLVVVVLAEHRRGRRRPPAAGASRRSFGFLQLAPGPAWASRRARLRRAACRGGLPCPRVLRSIRSRSVRSRSARRHRRAGEESGLVAAPVERPALLVEETTLERQSIDRLAVGVALGLGRSRRG